MFSMLFGKERKERLLKTKVTEPVEFPSADKLREDTSSKVQEADLKAKEYYRQNLNRELKEILEDVTEAAYSGNQFVFLDYSIYEENKTHLESLGYRVMQSGLYDYTRIFWSKDV